MKPRADRTTRPVKVTRALLARWQLPLPSIDGDKEDRGRLLVVAGAADTPGAAILAANAALRTGVGKITVATIATSTVARAVPEAQVVYFDVRRPNARASRGDRHGFDAILVGPGMRAGPALGRYATAALATQPPATVVLDAGALVSIVDAHFSRRTEGFGRCILTPHAGEMARMTGLAKDEIESAPIATALRFTAKFDVVLVLKGATTHIASRGRLWIHTARNIGLATSGSGDVLAGVIAALAARGAPPEQAAVWGVALHAMAGARLVRRYGALGLLAREIPHEIPVVMNPLSVRA